ncbi:hypothetical protein L3Q82_021954 [Scortum barcoo]|uniref:Uncharacterized protein n=1 Tax=Scortum barcoo TaxID=214431 RepID=A0ACB8X090_9TELE|nr:hypothetical protein L3Q82_021954 [Scortum barcoo]
MEENKEKDKLTSMQAEVSKLILAESAIKKTFPVKTSKSQKETHGDSPQDETFGILTDKEGATDEMTKETMSLQQSITLEDKHQGEEIEEQKHIHSVHKQRQEVNLFAADLTKEQNVLLQMQTEIREQTVMDDDHTESVMNVREKGEVEKQISKLKEKEEKIRGQIQDALENMEEQSQEIKRLILEINDLQSHQPGSEPGLQITAMETGSVEEGVTGKLKETEHDDILRASVFKHENIKYDQQVQKEENGNKVTEESDLVRMDAEGQKHESRKAVHNEEIDGGSYKKDMGGANIQRLKAEIYRTQEIIRLVKLEVDQTEENYPDKDHKDEDSEIDGLLQDMKQFQELLKMVKSAMRQSKMCLKEEMSNMKSMEIAAKKQKRELDQRLEKTLIERDQLDIMKIKIQRQTQVIEQKMEKMAKVKSRIEKMAANTRKKSENIEINMKIEVKLRQLEDLNYKIQATKQELENNYLLISKRRADLDKFKTEIRKKKDREYASETTEKEKGDIKKCVRAKKDTEKHIMAKNKMGKKMEEMENKIFRLRCQNKNLEAGNKLMMDSLDQKNSEIEQMKNSIREQVKQKAEREDIETLKQKIESEKETVRIAKQQAEAKIHEMNCLRQSIERQKQELDNKAQMMKREIREMELLKSELEIKKKENGKIFRKSMRKKVESEIILNELQREKELLRRETKKRGRELDQRLEKTRRERDGLEMLKIKQQQQEEELAGKKQSKDNTTLVKINGEHGQQGHERQEVKSIKEKAQMVHQSVKVTECINEIQNMRQKVFEHLEIIDREMENLKNINIHLWKQRDDLKALKAENKTVRDNMSRIKSQIKMGFEKNTIEAKVEMVELVHMREDVQNQNQTLEVQLEKIKRERRKMEVLKYELEIKRRENQRMIRKGIRNERKVRKMWAEIEEEKDALKSDTQKRKKEVDRRLERISRDRDELQIMKLKLKREKDECKDETEELSMKTVTKVESEIEIQTDLLEQVKQDIQEEKEKMEITKTEFQKKKENLQSLFDEINKERTNIKDLSLQVETERDKLQNVMNSVALKQEEQERKEDDIRRQTQELDNSKRSVLAERHELELLRKNLNVKKEELEVATSRFSGEREQMSKMKIANDKEREMLLNEKHRIEGERSELKMREDQLMNNNEINTNSENTSSTAA